MIECPGWAAKKGNSQAQRGRNEYGSEGDEQMGTESHI
jgi:hypothetical protein